MKNVMGIIYTAENSSKLNEITSTRSIAAVPVGGRYRVIDFILSNMVNSSIRNIGIITQNHYNSLMDHLGPGKEWDLNRNHDGLFIFPPYAAHNNPGWYKGSAEALRSIMGYIRLSSQKYVILSLSNMVCNMTFNDAFQFHIDKGADITMIYKEDTKMSEQELRRNLLVQTHEDGRVWDIQLEPFIPKSSKISMRMYIIEKSLLEYLVEECVARGNSDFVKDILLNNVDSLKIYGYPFDGYLANINSILSYYRHNMDLLDISVRNELFSKSQLIHTRVRDEAPVKYSENAHVENCLVADGCVIEGEVFNSVLFRGVKVCRGAKIKNSVIMGQTQIMENVILENAILDKDVIIRNERKLIGQENYPMVIRKGAVV